jgi:hypothetical protein
VNVRVKHVKGHQNKKGFIMGGGQYQDPVSFSSFRNSWIDLIKDCLIRIGTGVNLEGSVGSHAIEGNWIIKVHRREIKEAYRQLGGAENFQSHSTCFCCLREMPEHPLPCQHVLCERCVFDHGKQKDNTTVEILECPLHDARFELPWLVRFKPINAGVRVLALDGGGIRGIVELEVLLRIEEYFDYKIPIQRFFDLIVGTSTGGIIALSLGLGTFGVEECIEWYRRLSKDAFTARPISGPGRFSTRYKTKPIEKALKQAFQDKYLFGGPQGGTGGHFTKVAVTASTETGQDPILFANYNRPVAPDQVYKFVRHDAASCEMKIWEAYVFDWPYSSCC